MQGAALLGPDPRFRAAPGGAGTRGGFGVLTGRGPPCRWVREGAVEPRRATAMLSDLADLAVTRYAHTALLPRVWELRGHATAHDAAYLALAEALPATVVTCDARMAGVRGVRAAVRVL